MNKEDICARIPHAGRMCLLAAVRAYSDNDIHCIATDHRDPQHPLRRHDRLHALCGIEYAAQAMAVHGRLLAGDGAKPAVGLIASVRDVRLLAQRLDDVAAALDIHATRLGGDAQAFIYEFDITAEARLLLAGRIAVKLLAAAP
jgi:predicted hotdog family 3-hydroxylacyl-ACP dehydratase